MSYIVRWISQQYDLIIKDNIHDAEVDTWFLMDNPKPMLMILSLYLLFVLKLGPQYMENRKPFAMKNVLLLYNLAISVYNGYMFTAYYEAAMGYPVKHLCVPPLKDTLPVTRILYKASWLFFMSKIIELLDTVFFVLRKKQSQVTILHVYHHAFMVVNTWLYLKYWKSEQGVVVGVINSFVHVIMYLYYFLAALGPDIQKYLWWKKYITVMQLTQFAIVLTFLFGLIVVNCKVHRALSMYMFFHTCIFVAMFLNFYRKAYNQRKKVKPTKPLEEAYAPAKNGTPGKYD